MSSTLFMIFLINILLISANMTSIMNNPNDIEIEINSERDLDNNIGNYSIYKLTNDITLTSKKVFNTSDTITSYTLKLNGHSLQSEVSDELNPVIEVRHPLLIDSTNTKSTISGGKNYTFYSFLNGNLTIDGNSNIKGSSNDSKLFGCISGRMELHGSTKKYDNGIKINSASTDNLNAIILDNYCNFVIQGKTEVYAKSIAAELYYVSTVQIIGNDEDDKGIIIKGINDYAFYMEESSKINISGKADISGGKEAVCSNDANCKLSFNNKIIHLIGDNFNTYYLFNKKDNVYINYSSKNLCTLNNTLSFYDVNNDKFDTLVDSLYCDSTKVEHKKYHEAGCLSEGYQSIMHIYFNISTGEKELIIYSYGNNINTHIKQIITEESGVEPKYKYTLIESIEPRNILEGNIKKKIEVIIYFYQSLNMDDLVDIQMINVRNNNVHKIFRLTDIEKISDKEVRIKIDKNDGLLGEFDFKINLKDKNILSFSASNGILFIYPSLFVQSVSLNNAKFTKNFDDLIYYSKDYLNSITITYNNKIFNKNRFDIFNNKNVTLEYYINPNNPNQIIINTKIFKQISRKNVSIILIDNYNNTVKEFEMKIKFVDLFSCSLEEVYLDNNETNVVIQYTEELSHFKGIDIVNKNNLKKVAKSISVKNMERVDVGRYQFKLKSTDNIKNGTYVIKTKFDISNLDFISIDQQFIINTKIRYLKKILITCAIAVGCIIALSIIIFFIAKKCHCRNHGNVETCIPSQIDSNNLVSDMTNLDNI